MSGTVAAAAANFDNQLLHLTMWANRTLRDGGGCGDDKGDGGGEFTAAYDRVYSITAHGDRTADERLYARLRACVTHHLNDVVAPTLERAAGGVELLVVARRVYTDYERSTGRLSDACAYLDAVTRRRGRGLEPVRAMARTAFRNMLLRRCDGPTADEDAEGHGDLLGRLEDAVVRSADVHLWAGHECADASYCGRTVLAAVADSAAPLGLRDALARRLCERFLDMADRRLRAFARTAAKAPTVDGYAEAAGRTIDAEAAVALRYGGPAVARAVAARASVLLVAERRAFVVHSDAGLCRMMAAGRDASAVAKVYALLTRLPEAAGPHVVADAVACFACRRLHGTAAGRHDDHSDGEDTGDADDVSPRTCTGHARFVGRVIRFQDAMDEYLRHAFADDPVVAHMVEYHVQRAIDSYDDAARHVARHISDLLSKPESPNVSSLDRAFGLLRYLDDRELDKFEYDYRYNMALRLAFANQTRGVDYLDDGREEMAFDMFVASCGRQRARKVRLFLDDVRTSRVLSGHRVGGERKAVDVRPPRSWPVGLDVIVVNRHVWPKLSRPPPPFRYPRCASTAFRLYRELYTTAYDGRRSLTFITQMCTAHVLAGRRGRRVQLTATMYQAAVLLLFNGPVPQASRAYLARETKLPEHQLRLTLESLVRKRVLVQTDRGGIAYVLHRNYKHEQDDADYAVRRDDAEDGNDRKTPVQPDDRLNLLQ